MYVSMGIQCNGLVLRRYGELNMDFAHLLPSNMAQDWKLACATHICIVKTVTFQKLAQHDIVVAVKRDI